MTQHGKAISILTEALNFPFAEPNDDTRCVQRMIHTAIPLVSQMVSELYEAQGEIEVLTMWGKAEEMNAADAISERNDLQEELEKLRGQTELDPEQRKAIIVRFSDINQYDDEHFNSPVCIDELPEEDKSDVMDWLCRILGSCAENAVDSVTDALEEGKSPFAFQVGEMVKITDGYAHIGEKAKVKSHSVGTGGMLFYKLEKIPGWWPQSSLKRVDDN